MRSDLVDIAGVVLHETERAYFFDAGTERVWLPKSQCQWDPDDNTMAMPQWLATEKGLI